MNHVTWDSRMATGIRAIDDDHHALVDILNALAAAVARDEGEKAVESALDALAHYVDEHFAREEHFMEQAGYPGMKDHVRQHQRMTTAIHELCDRYHAGAGSVDPRKVVDLLKTWLIEHIMKADMDYVPYLRGEKTGETNTVKTGETRPVIIHVPPEDTGLAFGFARALEEDGETAGKLRALLGA